MSEEFEQYLKESITKIEQHLALINNRYIKHDQEITILKTRQDALIESQRTAKSLLFRILASVVGTIIIMGLGIIFGKSL